MLLTAVVFWRIQAHFLNIGNVMDILLASSYTGIMAIGAMLAMAVGEINFAVGAQALVTTAIIGVFMDGRPSGMYAVAILLAAVFAAASGLLIAFMVVELRVPSFIATLGLSTVLKGFTNLFCNDKPFTSNRWPKIYTALGQGELFGVIPIPVLIFAVVGVIAFILTEMARCGHYMFAVGSDPTACRQVGIDVRKVKYVTFIISSLLAACSGLLYTSLNATVTLKLGDELLMPALCAALLSTTYYKIGFYNIPGTVLSSTLLIMIQNGVMSVGAPYYVKEIMQGIVLLIAVSVIATTRKGGLPKVTFESG